MLLSAVLSWGGCWQGMRVCFVLVQNWTLVYNTHVHKHMHCLQTFGCRKTRRSTFRPPWNRACCCWVCGVSHTSPLSSLPPSDSCAGATHTCGSVCEPVAENTLSVLCASACRLVTQFSPGKENPGFLAWVVGSKHQFCPFTPAK